MPSTLDLTNLKPWIVAHIIDKVLCSPYVHTVPGNSTHIGEGSKPSLTHSECSITGDGTYIPRASTDEYRDPEAAPATSTRLPSIRVPSDTYASFSAPPGRAYSAYDQFPTVLSAWSPSLTMMRPPSLPPREAQAAAPAPLQAPTTHLGSQTVYPNADTAAKATLFAITRLRTCLLGSLAALVALVYAAHLHLLPPQLLIALAALPLALALFYSSPDSTLSVEVSALASASKSALKGHLVLSSDTLFKSFDLVRGPSTSVIVYQALCTAPAQTTGGAAAATDLSPAAGPPPPVGAPQLAGSPRASLAPFPYATPFHASMPAAAPSPPPPQQGAGSPQTSGGAPAMVPLALGQTQQQPLPQAAAPAAPAASPSSGPVSALPSPGAASPSLSASSRGSHQLPDHPEAPPVVNQHNYDLLSNTELPFALPSLTDLPRISNLQVLGRPRSLDPAHAVLTSGTGFPVRQLGYLGSGIKGPSAECVYEFCSLDLFRSDMKVHNIAQRLTLPLPPSLLRDIYNEQHPLTPCAPHEVPAPDTLDVAGPLTPGLLARVAELSRPQDGLQVPPYLVVTFQAPLYSPSMFGSVLDGEGLTLVFVFALSGARRRKLRAELDAGDPAAKLLQDFCMADCVSRRDTLKGRFKGLPNVLNLDEVDLGMVVGNTIAKYNRKPFLTGPVHQRWHRGANYLECDVDCHEYQYIARKAASVAIPHFKDMRIEMGFAIEGRADDELPERVLGAIEIRKVDLYKAKNIDELYPVGCRDGVTDGLDQAMQKLEAYMNASDEQLPRSHTGESLAYEH